MRDLALLVFAGFALYFAADRLLWLIERQRGHRFAERQVAFLLILAGLALPVFWLLRRLTA